MKLKELNEAIATTCNVRAQVVNSVLAETFRQVGLALDKGERVTIPEFGIFSIKNVAGDEGKPGRKVVRFKSKTGEKKARAGGKKEGSTSGEDRKAERKKKRAEAKAGGKAGAEE